MGDTRASDRVFERFQLIVNAPALFNALVSGVDLGLFAFLSRSPNASFEDIQRAVDIPPHQLRVLLFAICTTELIEKDGDSYRNSEVAESALAHDQPGSWQGILRGFQRFQYPAFPHLSSALRSGKPTALDAYPGSGSSFYERISHDPEAESGYHAFLVAFAQLLTPQLLQHEGLASVRHLLDVGGGSGETAVLFAERFPEAKVTVFDLPTVSQLGARTLPASVQGRISFHPGNLMEDRFPGGVDGILFSHVVEIFSAERILSMFERAFEALVPGGKIFLYNMTAQDDEKGGPLCARASLFFNVLASGEGMTYPARDYEAWLRQVGFASVETFRCQYEHAIVVGTKA